MPRVLVITPIDKIPGVRAALERIGEVVCDPDPTYEKVLSVVTDFDAIFTNPNKSKVYLSKELLQRADKLRVICTASTGTNHIDLETARARGIEVLSLKEERETINRISSTAEHALALFMSALRRVPQGLASVRRGEWDYEPFTGRQVSIMTVGVLGYGRLGKFFACYAKALGARVLVYDPHPKEYESGIESVSCEKLLTESDAISLHVHVTPETECMVNAEWLSRVKKDLLLVNTSRGEIVDEEALVEFLKKNPEAMYATDVVTAETRDRLNGAVLRYAADSDQVIVTPHVGGMTREAQAIAYGRAAELLDQFFQRRAAGA